MCGHQHTKSQTRFACRHLLKLCTCGIIIILKFFVYLLMYENHLMMLRLQSEQTSERGFPGIQISALATESVIECSHLTFFSPGEIPFRVGKIEPLVISLFSSSYSTCGCPLLASFIYCTLFKSSQQATIFFSSWWCRMCSAL